MSLLKTLFGLADKPAQEPSTPGPPSFEELVVQTMLWREYMKYIRDNNIPIDKMERERIDQTYVILKQEIRLRLGVMRRTVLTGFAHMVTIPLNQGGFMRESTPIKEEDDQKTD